MKDIDRSRRVPLKRYIKVIQADSSKWKGIGSSILITNVLNIRIFTENGLNCEDVETRICP